MSDFNSSLPVRTENAGDVKNIQVDATVPSQGASIDANGAGKQRIADASGNLITSGAQGTQRALDVEINFGSAVIDPRSVRALTAADVVTANQGSANTITNAWPVKLTDGTNTVAVAPASTAASVAQAAEVVALSPNSPLPAGTNALGSVKAQLQDNAGTAITLGQKTMSASVPVVISSDQTHFPVEMQDNSGNGLTSQVNGTQRALDVGINVAGVQIDPRQIRALTAADVVTANVKDATGNPFSISNPLPVVMSQILPGTEVNDYNTVTSIAAQGVSNHDYTISTGKTFKGHKFHASASGKMKIEIQISADGTTFTSKFVCFNSVSNPDINLDLGNMSLSDVGTGSKIRVIRTNKDLTAQDLYSTISGQEI